MQVRDYCSYEVYIGFFFFHVFRGIQIWGAVRKQNLWEERHLLKTGTLREQPVRKRILELNQVDGPKDKEGFTDSSLCYTILD